jgi:hypothetical protein
MNLRSLIGLHKKRSVDALEKMEHFFLRAQDPSGEWVHITWKARQLPQPGDIILLPDSTGQGQEVIVSDRVFYSDGTVDIWLDGFSNWEPGRVAALFAHAGEWIA